MSQKKTYLDPKTDTIPKPGTVFIFKGARRTPNNVFVVVSDQPIREDAYDGPYYFFGVTCITLRDLIESTENPFEYHFHFPRSSMTMGDPMREWSVIRVIEEKIKKHNVTIYTTES